MLWGKCDTAPVRPRPDPFALIWVVKIHHKLIWPGQFLPGWELKSLSEKERILDVVLQTLGI